MQLELKGRSPTTAQLTDCECVVLAETKDYSNWKLLGQVAEVATGTTAKAVKDAYRCFSRRAAAQRNAVGRTKRCKEGTGQAMVPVPPIFLHSLKKFQDARGALDD